jgi:hypothetical protein
MRTFNVTFKGRQAGAIGTYYRIEETISAVNDKDFAQAFYDQYEIFGNVAVNGKPYDFPQALNSVEIPANDNDMVSEMSDRLIKSLRRTISKFFNGQRIWTNHQGKACEFRLMSDIDEHLGLPYTSGSELPALWNTNNQFLYLGNEIKGFTVSKDGLAVMMTQDEKETWRYFVIGKASESAWV